VNLTVSGDQIHGVPTDSSNLVVKAVELIAEKFELDIDVSIDIKKSIPVAGGMAGGSADAAAAIVAIDELYSLDMTREEMHSIASKLGSDVPFLLSGGTAIG
ncbi:MAG: 4-(cytidine 5'-diphospho)-2-C-methyl-D-erythritol kinase, partial [bacterium]